MKSFLLPALLLALLLPLVAGCPSLLGVSEDDEPEEARIILGKSIDDVEIGDRRAEVKEKLGRPDRTLPSDLAGELYQYGEDRLEIQVAISDDSAVGLGVVGISVYAPYSGETESGIGIGTPRSEVLETLGAPDKRDGPFEIYEHERNKSVVEYRNGVVYSIFLRR